MDAILNWLQCYLVQNVNVTFWCTNVINYFILKFVNILQAFINLFFFCSHTLFNIFKFLNELFINFFFYYIYKDIGNICMLIPITFLWAMLAVSISIHCWTLCFIFLVSICAFVVTCEITDSASCCYCILIYFFSCVNFLFNIYTLFALMLFWIIT